MPLPAKDKHVNEREVIATALEDAATDWTKHQRENMGKGAVEQISAWLRARANNVRNCE